MQKCYNLRLATEKDFPSLKKLWKETFHDSDSVIDNFFEKTVIPENTVAVFDGERAVSALYALECGGKVGEKEINAYYIYGVSTLKEYRHQGLMKKTLNFIEFTAKERGVDALFLVPAEESLFKMYEKFGYEANIFYKETEIERFTLNDCYVKEEVSFNEYKKMQKNAIFPVFFLKKDVFCSFFYPAENGINCFAVKDNGYCVYENENGEITVHEFFGNKKILLSEIFKRENANTLKLREYSENKDTPCGMTRFLNNTKYAENFFFGVPYGG